MYDSYSLQGPYLPKATGGLEDAITRSAGCQPDSLTLRSYQINWPYSQPSTAIQQPYVSSSVSALDAKEQVEKFYHPQQVIFLNPERPRTPFIAEAGEIKDFVQQAFIAVTGKTLPSDITITVCPRSILQRIHEQFLNETVVGLSLNSSKQIFAVSGNLDEVMLVLGHELGHVITQVLPNRHVEEAKAFAFESAWANAIFEHDIGGLKGSINAAMLGMKPARNGLHDLAFEFVKSATMSGKDPLALHSELSGRWVAFGDLDQPEYFPLTSSSTPAYRSGGYLNKSNVQNVPWFTNFSWADLGTGIYGMYLPLTASIFMNERLLLSDLEQFHKTIGHEYVLHHVMKLPDDYVAKILEDTIFWIKEEEKYRP